MSLINTYDSLSSVTSSVFSKFIPVKYLAGFGHIPDEPDENDWKFASSPLISEDLVDFVSLKKYFKAISHQGYLSSCTANAVADTFEAQVARKKNIHPFYVKDLSRLFIYWNARNLANPPKTNIDKGSRIRLGFDSIARYGAPYEEIYPYIPSKVNDRPSLLAYREAPKNRVSAFYRIDASGDELIRQIIIALSGENPVVFGIEIDGNFVNCRSNVIIQKPSGGIIGSHAMVIVGWSHSRQAFEVRNSWGEAFGVNGYCFMSVDYIKSMARDIWVATV